MNIVCLDLEGVLVPEIWIAVAESTGIEGLKRTTRDEPDYDVLMRYRLGLLDEHGITLPRIQEVIGGLRPLDGAVEFINWLRAESQVIILSDTFAEFAQPLMAQLNYPTLLCHELVIGPGGKIENYRLRQQDQKRKAIEALQSLNLTVFAAGDSYNDLSMLQAANQGILFRPSERFAGEYPDFPVVHTHADLRRQLESLLSHS